MTASVLISIASQALEAIIGVVGWFKANTIKRTQKITRCRLFLLLYRSQRTDLNDLTKVIVADHAKPPKEDQRSFSMLHFHIACAMYECETSQDKFHQLNRQVENNTFDGDRYQSRLVAAEVKDLWSTPQDEPNLVVVDHKPAGVT